MNTTSSLCDVFKSIADDLDRERCACVKPQHLHVNVHRACVQAGRLALESLAQTTLFDGTGLNQFAALLVRPNDDSSATLFWKMAIIPCLSAKWPSRMKPNASAFDFPKFKMDDQGRVLGKDGRPLKRQTSTDPKTGFTSLKTLGKPARVTDDYDEEDLMAHLRVQAINYADACRLLADLMKQEFDVIRESEEIELGKVARKLVEVLADEEAFGEKRIKTEDLADLAGYPIDSSLVGTTLARLKERGILDNTYHTDRRPGYFLTKLGKQVFLHSQS